MIGKTTFRDGVGRLWKVEITPDGIERAKWIGVDLTAPDMITYLSANPVVALNVIYYVVKPQADARGITGDEFTRTCGNAQTAIACMIEAMKMAFPK